jgi:hypothetical protein
LFQVYAHALVVTLVVVEQVPGEHRWAHFKHGGTHVERSGAGDWVSGGKTAVVLKNFLVLD